MKRTLSLLLAFLFLAGLLLAAAPFGASAMSHDKAHQHHQAPAQKTQDHGAHGQSGHDMHGGHAEMAMLGAKVENGIEATAHLNDVGEAMAKMGMKETHHFMVLFVDAGTGVPVERGNVALKIKGPGGSEIGPVVLVGMDGHFGADIVLPEKGQYEFTVGTKLADGKTRQFQFSHRLK
jgi:hypothetical protein